MEFINRFIVSLSLIFASLTGSYIGVAESSLTFDFKTGNPAPIYYTLNIQNIGVQTARFDTSSGKDWIFVYREGQGGSTNSVSVQIPQSGSLNLILEIHPQSLADGQHQAEISINAVHPNDYSTLDSKTIPLVLNKNVVAQTQTPSPAVQTPAPMPTATTTSMPAATPTMIPSPSPKTTLAPIPASPTIIPTSSVQPESGPEDEPRTASPSIVKRFIDSVVRFFGSIFGL